MKKLYYSLFLLGALLSISVKTYAQMESNSNPMHLFFEYGNLGTFKNVLNNKPKTHLAAGLKIHRWKEDRPIQFELDMNYRGVSFYDSSEVAKKLGLVELYLGPRLLISKTSPLYPTASVLGGWYGNLGSVGGFSALVSLGMYYNFTPPGTNRNGISLELTYHTAKINFDQYLIPAAFALRIGVFF